MLPAMLGGCRLPSMFGKVLAGMAAKCSGCAREMPVGMVPLVLGAMLEGCSRDAREVLPGIMPGIFGGFSGTAPRAAHRGTRGMLGG